MRRFLTIFWIAITTALLISCGAEQAMKKVIDSMPSANTMMPPPNTARLIVRHPLKNVPSKDSAP